MSPFRTGVQSYAKTISAAACALMLAAAGPQAAGIVREQAYGADPEQRLDLCFPRDRSAATTLIIGIHGGGLFLGDKAVFTPRVCSWFTPHGIVVASVNYRLATGGPAGAWPDSLADVQLAVRWLRLHVADYGVNIRRICAVGNSSGAHLAVFLDALSQPVPSDVAALLPGPSSGVDCAVDQWGPVDYRDPSPLMRKQMSLLFPGAPAAADARAMSPILLVHSGMGPILIMQGLSDPITHPSQSRDLLATLQAHHVPARMITFAGGHGTGSDAWNRMAAQSVLPFIENGQ